MTIYHCSTIGFLARAIVYFSCVVLLLEIIAGGQVSRTSGSIQGSVLDQTGSVISNASVRITNPDTNQSRRATTNSTGTFMLSSVPAGAYQLTIQSPGFALYQNNALEVTVGSITSIAVRLAPATTQQQVSVSDESPPTDVTQTSVATTIGPERIEESPVVGRNYLNFVLLAPSLSQSNHPQDTSSATALSDSGFTFAGLRSRSNSLSIDGVENNDEFDGSVRTELSPETVHELQVVNNGLSAESGGGAGGSINVVTKSGANVHHGDAFLFVQNGALNAREPLTNETTRPDLSRQRAGLALGGPALRNRTFYYLATEQERSHGDDSSLISAVVASSINTVLASGVDPGLRSRNLNAGTFPIERAETEASGRLDHQINANNSFLVKYAFTNNREIGDAFNTGGLVDHSSRGSSFTRDGGLTAGFTSTLSSSTVNSASLQISGRKQVLRTSDERGPGIDIAGIVQFGRSYLGNSQRKEDHFEGSDTVSLLRGQHLLKFGANGDYVTESALIDDAFGAYYIFPTLTAFLTGSPDEYLQSFGNPQSWFGVTRYAGFVQDHWSISKRLTLDEGLRYESEQLPSVLRQDTNNFAPRIGIAFTPMENWVLRAGMGVFYDRYVLAALNRNLEWNGVTGFQQFAYGSAAAQIFSRANGGAPTKPTLGIAPSIFRPATTLSTPYSEIASAAVEHLIGNNLSVTATYLFAHGVKLPRTVNANLPPPVSLTTISASSLEFGVFQPQEIGREVFGPSRLTPSFSNIYELQDQSNSTYNGVSVVLNRRLSNEIEFSGSYTLSKTLDDASDFSEQPQNPYAIRAERSLSANDQRHRFVFSGTFDLPFGDDEEEGKQASSGLLTKVFGNIEAAPIVSVGSGRTVNPLVGFDADHSGAFPLSSRPLAFGRNSLQTPAQIRADLRILKYFKVGEHGKLDLVAESFNLFNHTNAIELNPFFGPGASPLATFKMPDRASIARELQFSLDFEF